MTWQPSPSDLLIYEENFVFFRKLGISKPGSICSREQTYTSTRHRGLITKWEKEVGTSHNEYFLWQFQYIYHVFAGRVPGLTCVCRRTFKGGGRRPNRRRREGGGGVWYEKICMRGEEGVNPFIFIKNKRIFISWEGRSALISRPILDLGFFVIQYHHKIQEGGCKEIQV